MNKIHSMYLLVIAALFVVIIFLRECSPKPQCGIKYEIITKDSLIYDSIPYEVKVKVLQPSGIVLVPVPANVDTALILADYFLKRYYENEIRDSNIVATIKDSISENKIISREFTYKLIQPKTIIQSTAIEKKRVKIFAGGEIGGNLTGFNAYPALLLVNKKDNAYTVKYGLFDKSINVGTYFKIR